MGYTYVRDRLPMQWRMFSLYKRKGAHLLAILSSAYTNLIWENKGTSSSCWSDLPLDIQQIICEKLVNLEDYIRFGAVSKTCRCLVWINRKNISTHQQLPLLMTPYSCGSSHGWLIYTRLRGRIFLFNPFLPVNNIIQLPDLPNDTYIKNAIISHNPTTDCYVVMALCTLQDKSLRLLFTRGGQGSWEILNIWLYGGHSPQNFIYYKDSFYVIGMLWLFSCNISEKSYKVTDIAALPLPFEHTVKRLSYLVESLGELLCVVKEVVDDEFVGVPYLKTVGCQIFKLNGRYEWIEVKSLSGQAIFIGQYTSLSVRALDLPDCKPNHIYFSNMGSGVHWMSVFNLEDGSIQYLVGDKRKALDWILPTLNMARPNLIRTSKTTPAFVKLRDMKPADMKREEESQKAKLVHDRIKKLGIRIRKLGKLCVLCTLVLVFSIFSDQVWMSSIMFCVFWKLSTRV